MRSFRILITPIYLLFRIGKLNVSHLLKLKYNLNTHTYARMRAHTDTCPRIYFMKIKMKVILTLEPQLKRIYYIQYALNTRLIIDTNYVFHLISTRSSFRTPRVEHTSLPVSVTLHAIDILCRENLDTCSQLLIL